MRRTKHSILYHLAMALLLLLLAAYLLLPRAIGYALRETLRQQGFSEVSLKDVRAEPVGGEFRITGLSAARAGGPPLTVGEAYTNIAWLALAQHRGQLQGLALKGVELTLTQDANGRISLSGLPLPAGGGKKQTADGTPWGFGIDRLSISDSRLHLRMPGVDLDLTLDTLELSGLHSWNADLPASLQLAVRTDDGAIQLDGQLTPFAKAPSAHGRLIVQGLDLERLARSLAGHLPADLAPQGRLDARLQLAVRLPATGPELTQNGRLTLRDLKLAVADHPQTVNQLDWDGTVGWSATEGVSSEGRLVARDVAVTDAGRSAAIGQLDWQGKTGWSAAAGVRADGALLADAVSAEQPDRQLMLARLDQLAVTGLSLGEGGQLTFNGLNLKGLKALGDLKQPKAHPRVQVRQAELGTSHIRGASDIDLGKLLVDGLTLELERDKAGKLPLIARLTEQTSPPATEQGGQTARPHIKLAGLRVAGDSRLSFTDLSVDPPFQQKMTLDKLTAGAMDSATNDWTPVVLDARLGEYGRVQLAGKAKPLASKVNVDLNGDLTAIDLQHLSSYAAAKLGYNLQSGQMDSKLRIKIIDNQLDSEAQLVLNKLTVKPADPKLMERLTRELSMPLDSALNMLRDGDDNIRLTLPVSGDIRKPDFDLSDIINKALGTALKGAAISYIKYALQPYGTLITLAQLADKAATRVALKPVPFPAGSAGLAADSAPYLDKLHDLLTGRPQLRVQICGKATEADRKALAELDATRRASGDKPVASDDRLLQLATERSANIKRQLVDRGISPERLFECNPEIDRNDKAQPRAELLL